MTDNDGGIAGIRRRCESSLHAYADRRAATTTERTLDPWAEAALLSVFAIAFWLIASNIPLNGDDWAWGSEIGITRLKDGFHGYNGRYAGNIIVLVMTRLNWATPILQAIGLAAMIGIILDATHNRTMFGYVTLSALVFFMPAPLWRQTVAWVSGYANYVTATLIMLVFLRSVLLVLSGVRKPTCRPVTAAGIFILALVSQLVVEHMTIYLLAASLFALLAGRFVLQQWSVRMICWVLGFGFGAVVMFSNSSYRDIAAGKSVKTVSQNSSVVSNFPFAVRDRISTYGLTSNAAVILVIAGLIAAVAVLTRTATIGQRKMAVVRGVALFGGVTTALVAATRLATEPVTVGSMKTVAAGAIVLGLVCLSIALLSDLSDRLVMTVTVGSWVLLNVPLLVVYPIPPRTFLPAYALLMMIVSVLASRFKTTADANTLVALTTVVAVAGLLAWNERAAIYQEINNAADARLARVRQQVEDGATELDIQPLPHKEWMARPDPFVPPYDARFKIYYELPEDVSISPPG